MELNNVLKELDGMIERAEIDKVVPFLCDACERAQQEGDLGSKLSLLNELIGFNREICQYEESVKYAKQALDLIRKMDMEGSIAHATTMLNIANALRAAGKLKESASVYEKVHQMYRTLLPPDDFGFADLSNNESLLYQEMKDFPKAMECLKNALDVVKHYPEREWELAVTYANLANTWLHIPVQQSGEIEKEETVRFYVEQAIALFDKLHVKDTHYAAALVAKGQLYERELAYSEAVRCYEQALHAVQTTLGKTDFYGRILEYLRAAVDKSGIPYEGQYRTEWKSGLELCHAYYETYGKPMLEKQYDISKMTIGLAGEGSDCFGFDDAYSHDHDWGPGFCIWLEDDEYDAIGEALQKDYDALPTDFEGYERRTTLVGAHRVGVIKESEFCIRLLGNTIWEYWKKEHCIPPELLMQVPSHRLAAFTNGEIYETGSGEYYKLREYLKHYDEAGYTLRTLCQAMALFSQNAQYNYPRMKRRGDMVSAMMLLHEGLKQAVHTGYILNKLYAPHDKWIMRGTEKFAVLTDLPYKVENILSTAYAERHTKKEMSPTVEELVEELANELLKEMLQQGYIGNAKLMPAKNGSQEEYYVDTYLEHYTSELMWRAQWNSRRHEELVEQIAKIEFAAFDEVKNEGGRAECQDDWETFHIMRVSQYATWNKDMLLQYFIDFNLQMERGWNPIMEKYGRMEEATVPEEWERIKREFPVIPPEKQQIMEEIIRIQVEWMEEFAKEYPGLAGNARRIHTSEDMPWDTSYETYLRGELSTYSDKMLKLYGQFIVGIVKEGGNLAYRIMENTVHMYGYQTLEEAMERME